MREFLPHPLGAAIDDAQGNEYFVALQPAEHVAGFVMMAIQEKPHTESLVATLEAQMTTELFLIVIHHQSQKPLSALRLNARSAIVGRSTKVDICLPDTSVSRRHAHLELVQSGVVIQDLGSRNGTFVQERRIQTVTVKPGQQIRFGSVPTLLSLQAEDGSEEETRDPRSFKSTQESQSLSPILDSLSPAQRRVLELLLQGLLEKDVAKKLGISQHTVHNHAREIYRAYRVHSRAQLLLQAIAIVDRRTDNG